MRHSKKHGPKKLTLAVAKASLRHHGMSLTHTEYGEYRVRHLGDRNPDHGYFCDNLDDAYRTGLAMAKAHTKSAYHKAMRHHGA